MLQSPDDLLGSADREGRDEEHATFGDDVFDGLRQLIERLVLGLVLAAAVGRLDEDVVRLLDDRGVAQDRGVGAAQIA